ncbi:MAG: class I poly(R)-hydroxyalkanoic acid synthase [Chloroflexi bacterium]|nr:class I poly(R)-hydroxyalkanoic acid synthase [Chloroflexota bacterium]
MPEKKTRGAQPRKRTSTLKHAPRGETAPAVTLPPTAPRVTQINEAESTNGNSTMFEEMVAVMFGSAAALARAQQANLDASTRTFELMTNAYARLWGISTPEALPADKRFANDAWTKNPGFDMLKQAYLSNSRWLLDLAEGFKEIDPALYHRARFYTKQFTDALSPTNFPLTNPVVIEETVRTGGANLVRGAQNLFSDALEGKIRKVPDNAFVLGKDIAVTPGKVVYRNKLIELIQYTPATPKVHAVPILVMAPWINKYYVLDLRPKNSMIKYLVDSGFTVFAISWKNPDSSLRDLTWEDYMSLGALDAARVIKAITGTARVNMVGYCVGGVLLETVVAYWAAKGDLTANTATYLAVHQDFDNVGDLACFISPPEVTFLEWLMSASGGYLDGKNMGTTFDLLRANDLLWAYVVNNYMLGKDPPAFDILSWNADHTRVPETMHSYYLRNFFLAKKLTKPNGLTLLGEGIDLKKITTPSFVLAMAEDHIVPWKSAFKMRELVSGPLRFTLAESGHIAGVINPPEAKARGYWCEECETDDPDEWLNNCSQKRAGSWWPDWTAWLEKQSDKQVPPPPTGNAEFPPLIDAPGSYVLEV